MLVLLPLLALLLPPVVSWDIDVAILNQLSGAVGGGAICGAARGGDS